MNEIAHALRFNIIVMFIGGAFKIQTQNKIKRTFYRLWRVTMNLIMWHAVFTIWIDLMEKGWRDIEKGILNYSYIVGCVCISFKLSYFYFFDKKSHDIVMEMCDFFKSETRTGLEEKHIKKSVSLVRIMTLLWILGTTVGSQSIMLIPLFWSKNSNRELPIPMWFPYDWHISPFYELTILYQIFFQELVMVTMVGTDMFFASLSILTAKQFRLLGWEIKHLLYTVLIMNGVDRETVVAMQLNMKKDIQPPPGFAKEINFDLLRRFSELIRFHQSLLKICDRLEEFFSPVFLLYFSVVLFLDIFHGFLMATVDNLGLSIIYGSYLFITTTALFVPCFFGEVLTTQAEAFLSDLYESPWYVCDETFKFHLKFLQLKATKPIYVTVGKFTNLTLSAFLWIEQTVISYVMMLYQLTHVEDK